MNLLAIDTATEACSVALQVGEAVHARHVEAPREHGERVLGMLDEVLAEADIGAHQLDLLALGRGPGAFTGVRMGTGLVQGIALGLDLPVVRVSTLVTLAQGGWRCHGGDAWLPAIDARMGEVYWGPCRIEGGVAVTVGEECVVKPERIPVPKSGTWSGIGTGWATYGDTLLACLGPRCTIDHGHALPVAADMLAPARRAWEQGEAVAAAAALPTYLRDRVAVPGKARD